MQVSGFREKKAKDSPMCFFFFFSHTCGIRKFSGVWGRSWATAVVMLGPYLATRPGNSPVCFLIPVSERARDALGVCATASSAAGCAPHPPRASLQRLGLQQGLTRAWPCVGTEGKEWQAWFKERGCAEADRDTTPNGTLRKGLS